MIDLHGAEAKRVPRARPPITVGPSAIIGLVGSAPDSQAAVAASADFGAGAAGFRVTADAAGAAGNKISVALVDPGANSSALAIAVAGQAITISLATDNAGALTSTATQLITALNAHADAGALVTGAVTGTGGDVVAVEPATALAGGIDEPFPAGTPTLITTAAQAAALGDTGALALGVRAVYRTAGQRGAAIVVVRTADDMAATLAGAPADKTGVYALLGAESVTGQKPRLIAAPGAQDDTVTTALQSVAADLAAAGAITLDVATVAAAAAASPNLSHIIAAWPKLVVVDDGELTLPADALMLGHMARIDGERSFAASPSNRLMRGVLRTEKPIGWAIDSRTSEANILNRAHLVTFIRRGAGVWFWGNRMSDGVLIPKRRADDIINDRVLYAVLDYLDRRIDLPFVEHVLGRLRSYLRLLVIAGHIRAGRAWFDGAYNTPETLAAAQVTFSFELTLHDIAEHIIIRSSVASVPNDIINQLTAA